MLDLFVCRWLDSCFDSCRLLCLPLVSHAVTVDPKKDSISVIATLLLSIVAMIRAEHSNIDRCELSLCKVKAGVIRKKQAVAKERKSKRWNFVRGDFNCDGEVSSVGGCYR